MKNENVSIAKVTGTIKPIRMDNALKSNNTKIENIDKIVIRKQKTQGQINTIGYEKNTKEKTYSVIEIEKLV